MLLWLLLALVVCMLLILIRNTVATLAVRPMPIEIKDQRRRSCATKPRTGS